MKPVILESPYKGKNYEDTEENVRFARLCLRDCLTRGEAPFASHLLYTQDGVLDDKIPAERNLGIEAGFAYKEVAKETVVYINRGLSRGMHLGVRKTISLGQEFEYRILSGYENTFSRSTICTVTGASGAGKSSILRKILTDNKKATLIKSYTTRSPRPSDLPNEYIYNVSREEFGKNSDKFLWVLPAHGNLYGTLKESISELFDFSPHTHSHFTPRFMCLTPEAVMVLRSYLVRFENHESRATHFYVLKPNREQGLQGRLYNRGDSQIEIQKRIDDCEEWDNEAIKSGTPYIFIGNNEFEAGIDKAAAQISLFF